MNTQIASIIRAAVPELKSVWDYDQPKINPLPAATVFWAGYSEIEDATSNIQFPRQLYIITVAVNMSDVVKAQVELKTIVDKILKALQNNRTLNGSCLYSKVTKVENKPLQDYGELISMIHLEAETQSIGGV